MEFILGMLVGSALSYAVSIAVFIMWRKGKLSRLGIKPPTP